MTRKTFDRIAQARTRREMWIRSSHLEDLPDRRSLRESFRLVRKTVSLGLREAQGSLAYAYDRVDSVRPSRRMALHWYRKAWRSGSSGAARNIGITMLTEGRTNSAILWFLRAMADDDPDVRLDLAKILLKDPSCQTEAHKLLEEYVAAGTQEIYAVRPDGDFPRVNLDARLDDEDHEEAKRLLQELKGPISV